MRSWFNALVIISLIFLIVCLYRNEYLFIPQIKSIPWLLFSLFFVFAGFILNANAWRCLLKANNVEISYTDSISSTGLSIFGKYIPGKFWTIIGRAAFVAKKNAKSIYKISMISLMGQVLSIITGIIIGSIVFFWQFNLWFMSAFIFSCFLMVFIISPLTKFISKKMISIDKVQQALNLTGFHLIKVLPCFFLFWFFWGVGFYGFTASLSDITTWRLIPAFILSGSIGVMAFFVPAGLGIREGVLSFLLINNGYTTEMAATIAVGSRLWFLGGELLIFGYGFYSSRSEL